MAPDRMTSRRQFLGRAGLLSLGLLAGPDVLEAWERLTYRRRYVPGWTPHNAMAWFSFPEYENAGTIDRLQSDDGSIVRLSSEVTLGGDQPETIISFGPGSGVARFVGHRIQLLTAAGDLVGAPCCVRYA